MFMEEVENNFGQQQQGLIFFRTTHPGQNSKCLHMREAPKKQKFQFDEGVRLMTLYKMQVI